VLIADPASAPPPRAGLVRIAEDGAEGDFDGVLIRVASATQLTALARTEPPPGQTLRERLGLPSPAPNRLAADAARAS
jgi:hypothetical protein